MKAAPPLDSLRRSAAPPPYAADCGEAHGRFYDQGTLVKTHPRKPPGGRCIDANDFPAYKSAYAMRNIAFLERQAFEHGESIGRSAHLLP